MLRGYKSGAYVLGMTLAYGIIGIGGLALLRFPLWPVHIDKTRGAQLLVFGLLATLGSIAAVLFEAPARLITNRYVGPSGVGILSAYQGGSIQMASFFVAAGAQVFFPIASRTPKKIDLFKKLNRTLRLILPTIAVIFFVILWIYLKLLGHSYPFNLIQSILFSTAATAFFVYAALTWFIVSFGQRGLIINGIIGIISGILNIVFCFVLIPWVGILGAAIAAILAYGAGIGICYFLLRASKLILKRDAKL
jgi:O-antigen/teichoic acid export membrane protein